MEKKLKSNRERFIHLVKEASINWEEIKEKQTILKVHENLTIINL